MALGNSDEQTGVDARIGQLRAEAVACAIAVPAAACPGFDTWDAVLAGALAPEESAAWLRHAVGCPHCGPLLRSVSAAAAIGGSIESEPELAVLPSSRPSGRHRLAKRLRRLQETVKPRSRGARRGWRSWACGAVAAVAVVAALAVWVPRGGRAYLAKSLVERAYAQHRSLALRFAGAEYGPLLGARRGAPQPPPGDLLEAEGLLAGALNKYPSDVALLQTQARAYLVAGNAAAALSNLQRALLLRPGAPSLETDLASAYYESAEAGRDADYSSALEHLGRVLAAAPRDPVALFNRALVEEALQDWTGAIADWTAYLGMDARGPWADEARQHLAAAQHLVGSHDAAVEAPLLSPGGFARLGGIDAGTDARIEDYILAATSTWLPAAYPVSVSGDPGARAGLGRLAAWLQQAHHDTWLRQLLSQASAHGAFPRAVAALAAAETANAVGKPDHALTAARQAEAAFAQAASPAGRVRAAYEEVYALHRAEQGAQCVAVLDQFLPARTILADGWLAGETAIERANCEGMAGKGGPADLAGAAAIGRMHGYVSLQMRAVSQMASKHQSPDSDAVWKRHREQLTLYWQARVGAYRAYQLDLMLAIFASQRRDWHAAERLAQAAVERVAQTPETSYQAMARQELANFADLDGDSGEAGAERARAEALFAALPQTPITANLRAYNQIDLASMEMQVGRPNRARAELAAYRRDQPPVVALEARALPYFAVLGQLELAQGHAAAAEQDERAAIAIDEYSLQRHSNDEDRLAWQERNRDAYRGWIQTEWRLHRDPIAGLEFWEWAKGAPVRGSRPLPPSFLRAAQTFDATGAPSLPEPRLVRATLPAMRQQQVVSYAMFPDELAIWIFDNRGIHSVRVPVKSARLEAAAHAFALGCADPATEPGLLALQGKQLYEWLLAPVAPWLDPVRTLIVESDGALAEIPFIALRTPNGQYIPQAVMQSPGLEYARLTRPTRPLATARLLAVADPADGADATGAPYPRLPETRAEAANAAAGFAAGSQVLDGEAATPAAVRAALPQAQILHFAGHADEGRLLLAGGALAASDLTPAALPRCQLAVLAACSTGAGATLVDSNSLVRACLRAGVANVIATRWQVDSAATRQFSQAFYAALRAGAPVPRALQTAEQQLRRQPATAAPFYWAAFAAFGTER